MSTDKYGTGTTENYLQMTENGNMNFRIPLNQKYSFKCENKQPLYIDKDSIQVENLFVLESQLVKNLNVSEKATVYDLKVNNDIIAAKVFVQSANLTWNNTANTLSTTNFIGSGSAITNLNVSNATSGLQWPGRFLPKWNFSTGYALETSTDSHSIMHA